MVSPAVLSPDGRWLAIAEEYARECVLQTVDLAVSPQVFSTVLHGMDSFLPLGFTPDETRLFTPRTKDMWRIDYLYQAYR